MYVNMNSEGQITLPKNVIEILGFLPNTELEVCIDGDDLRIRKKRKQLSRIEIRQILQKMSGSSTSNMTTDEIMSLTRGDN